MTHHLNPPASCDTCKTPFPRTAGTVFFDARLQALGTWANVCPRCAKLYNVQLGTGRGQRYEYRVGAFEKTGG